MLVLVFELDVCVLFVTIFQTPVWSNLCKVLYEERAAFLNTCTFY